MPSRPQNKAIGGCTPLGVITIVAGTPIQIISPTNMTNKVGFVFTARQLQFSVSGASTGEVYVNYGQYAGLDANATVLIIQKGQTQVLPAGGMRDGVMDVTRFWVDGSVSGDKVAINALDASS